MMQISNLLLPCAILIVTIYFSAVDARVFSCDNSTLLYSVKNPDDESPMVIFQNNNITRVFYQDQQTGFWDKEAEPNQHDKTCDFRVITTPVENHCLSTTEGLSADSGLKLCADDKVKGPRDVVAEHMVLVACSTEESAFAKVVNPEGGTHFLAAFHTMSQLESAEQWHPSNMSATIEAFMKKATCDEAYAPTTSSAIAISPMLIIYLISLVHFIKL
uniref:Ricin B lectin domain-containing protein n=1 Tax=Spongospora subterranea TaxID=70186 RepID=A0A0H5RE25_9EUKA|eukprot:CRZ12505.1 hypothetical protein [Spongospora subterranea]